MPLSTFKLFSFSRSTTNPPKHDSARSSTRPTLLGQPFGSPDRLGVAHEKDDGVGTGHPRLAMGHSSPRARSRSPNPTPTRSRDRQIRPRSRSRRRYEPAQEAEVCPYCPERQAKRDGALDHCTARSRSGEGRTRVGRDAETCAATGSDDGALDVDLLQGTRASGRFTASRPPLFDDVDDLEVDQLSLSSTSTSDEDDDDDLDVENDSLFSFNSPPTSAYSLGRSPSTRKSSLSTTATSDPLISPSSVPSVPVLSFGSPAHLRGHWLPATPNKVPAPSAESQFAPCLPDPTPAPAPSSQLSSSPEKQGLSLRRASSLTSFSPSRPSLLSKSLRSLASLPNLALPNLLPHFHRPDVYLTNSDSQSPTLTSGWGAKERRRVLDSEPSWDADEARGLLSRRARRSLSLGGRVVAETEAESCGSTNGSSTDADLALSDFSVPVLLSPPPSPALIDGPLTPRDDLAPLSPPSAPPSTPLPPPPPPPSQRFISNTRHLLMLSIEFSMMRADKISSPLRPRAVIVRNGSPTRGGGTGLGPSRLRNEVV